MKITGTLKKFYQNYSSYKNPRLFGRYLTYNHIAPELDKFSELFKVEDIGESVLKVPIKSVTFGNGPIKVLGWSQMHGNESTTTKALFDLMNLFEKESSTGTCREIMDKCTVKFIPMLNPDGAIRYTRENVNGIDLNRDARLLKEDESRVLRSCFEDFRPQYCLNLHDQRTIFSAGDTGNPATLSFLAPAMEKSRNISGNREKAMQLIAAINHEIQNFIPNQVGRYDDSFNINCTGDFFQASGVPTILFEAGHFRNDYLREKTREFVAIAIFSALLNITSKRYEEVNYEEYFRIPENKKNFFDIILRDAEIRGEVTDVAIQFKERIKSGKIDFEPVVQKLEAKLHSRGHREIFCERQKVRGISQEEINENAVVPQILLNNSNLSIKSIGNS